MFLDLKDRSEFDKHWKEPHREDWYAAQQAYQIFLLRWDLSQLFAKDRKSPTVTRDDFMLKIKFEEPEPEKELTPEEAAEKRRQVSEWAKLSTAVRMNVDPKMLGLGNAT